MGAGISITYSEDGEIYLDAMPSIRHGKNVLNRGTESSWISTERRNSGATRKREVQSDLRMR